VNKSTAVIPFVNAEAKDKALFGLAKVLWGWADEPPTRKGPLAKRSIKPFCNTRIAKIDPHSGDVTFDDGRVLKNVDTIVLASGYRQWVPFFEDGKQNEFPQTLNIINPEEPTLGFFGFVRPNVGAIPPMAELQALWWIFRCLKKPFNGSYPDRSEYLLMSRELTKRTGEYGCDYGHYMHTVARDISAAPTLSPSFLIHHPKAFAAYCLGQAFVGFFRLQGPAASSKCMEIAETELWESILRRGIVTNFVLLIVSIVFGWVNFITFIVDYAYVKPTLMVSKVGWKALKPIVHFACTPLRFIKKGLKVKGRV